ncbi:MAG: xanthine dehydrogenase family protein molybdopterin-binding subunit [Actinomycetota bacterium]
MTTVPPSAFGTPALRTEDPRFLRGEGRYLENISIPGALRAVFVRSMFPHATLQQVRGVDEARAMRGVVAVFTAEDLAIAAQPPSGNVEAPGGELELPFHREALARDRLRFVGEPFAVVLAETLAQAMDAAEVVWAEAEPVEAVTDPEVALLDGAPLLWPELGTNVAHTFAHGWEEDVMAGAEVVVRGRFVNQRLAPVPMETNAIAVVPESGGGYTIWVSTQVPFDVRNDLAELLGVDRGSVRVIAPDVGGGFGAKLAVYPEYQVVAKAAQLLGRPVRWSESRSESMVAMTHGRSQVQHVEIGGRRDGTLVGMRVELIGDMGAYPIGAYLPTTTAEMLAGVYRWGAIAYRGRSVVTNATPMSAYRGAGRPEAAALVERAIDLLAAEIGMDPVAIRRKNLVPPDAFPFTTAVGTVYDTGDYAAPLDEALRLAGYDALRAEQRERRERGDHLQLGIGVATYVEITAFPSKEFARVEVGDVGDVTVFVGTSSHGQGHETAFAQLVGAILTVPAERVRVVHSDTALVQRGEGTWGSRSLQAGGSSIVARTGELIDRAREVAAQLLEVDVADLEGPVDGGFRVAGAPDRAATWARLADAVHEEGGLAAQGVSRDPGSTFPFGAHIAVMELDVRTGDARLVRHVAVDDCGRILNPVLVRGQQHGGIAQGVAQALYEEVRYDEVGNPVTGNLTGYAMPGPPDLPRFECANTQTPTTVNPLGVKGVGESGSIGSTPAVQNAVVDALAHLGVRHVDLPCTPERVWLAIAAGVQGASRERV